MTHLIFEKSSPKRRATTLGFSIQADDLPAPELLRKQPLSLPECDELTIIRHYTQLSQQNFCIETQFYPLGSCTMKYNPRLSHQLATLPGFTEIHPLSPPECQKGLLTCLYELQSYLVALTGMAEVSLAPMAGAQGELAGMMMIKAYHQDKGDYERQEILVSQAAHGTNPATAAFCGFKVREVPHLANGDIDLEALALMLGPQTAGMMLTNPSTFGLFERQILSISGLVHQAGGLLYYDGANLNALLGQVKPADMGFDILHLNLHKTFATPHGGGGPGAGPVAVKPILVPYLPTPKLAYKAGCFTWLTADECPKTIGSLSTFRGNTGVLLRAYAYLRLLGREGCPQVSLIATLNANYLMKKLQALGYTLAFPERRASHEFIISLESEKADFGITALDLAKRLLDAGFYAPTIYFPQAIPESLLIEPTETESIETLETFIEAMRVIRNEMIHQPELVKQAPTQQKNTRLDEVKAARNLDLVWRKIEN